MKKRSLFAFCAIAFLLSAPVFAQDQGAGSPYLSADDIVAYETYIPESSTSVRRTFGLQSGILNSSTIDASGALAQKPQIPAGALFHLLILDRTYAPLDSDIGETAGITQVYKFKHGRNGYLVAVYITTDSSQQDLSLPAGSRALTTVSFPRKETMKEYIDSSAFRHYVTHSTIIAQLNALLENS